ncbi:cell division protein FtsL [Lapidilactobacillus gannanensis]|uniref:Cell division protein FtsL n=1 Tax=Lapidilactobacillus gannanensis TaxID=2486002 RepID=A0ABW4BS87_9LACO|nr:cell division protein FtsL [Lapidilactobacillus gannanensis]
MNDNTVRKIETEPLVTPDAPATPAHVDQEQSARVAFSGLERVCACCAGIATIALMIFLVHTNVGIAGTQRQLQDVQVKISQIKATNVDLRQEVSELSSSDRLSAYAQKNGLTFNDANVRNVSK